MAVNLGTRYDDGSAVVAALGPAAPHSSRTFVIAEAAACHDGDYTRALRLVEVAAEVGADAVKFQWLSVPDRLVQRRRAPEYRRAYETIHFPEHWFGGLRDRAKGLGLEFLCTAYLPEDVHIVARYVDRFKISSFESLDHYFIALHGEFPQQVILSVGMASLAEIEKSVRAYARAQARVSAGESSRANIRILHCVSAYPCPPESANLRAIPLSCHWFGEGFDGYSDHTRHSWTGALAVAAGARIVEFHLRLHSTDPANADYEVARTSEEAAEYVRNIRTAESMMGSGTKAGPSEAEAAMTRYRAALMNCYTHENVMRASRTPGT